VALQRKFDESMMVWLSKMVLTQHFTQDEEAGKRHSKAYHLLLID